MSMSAIRFSEFAAYRSAALNTSQAKVKASAKTFAAKAARKNAEALFLPETEGAVTVMTQDPAHDQYDRQGHLVASTNWKTPIRPLTEAEVEALALISAVKQAPPAYKLRWLDQFRQNLRADLSLKHKAKAMLPYLTAEPEVRNLIDLA